jgi:F-type H+-transporting ATPase subunit delta
MAADAITIARPYAEAVFAHAEASGKLDLWSEMLGYLSVVVADPAVAPIIGNPLVERKALIELLLEICGEHISQEGGNLIRLLVANGRLPLVPEIESLFKALKADRERTINVQVTSAFALKPEQEKIIAKAVKAKLGREVTISSVQDPELIGGVHIRAGDLVIDGTVRGKLQRLANELGI